MAFRFLWENRSSVPGISITFPRENVEINVGAWLSKGSAQRWWGREVPNMGGGHPDYVIGEPELALLAKTLRMPRPTARLPSMR